MTSTEIKLNRIEENLLFHWECLIESNGMEGLTDFERDEIHLEVQLFLEQILPGEPTPGWAFWSDGAEFLTKSEELADRLADIMDAFADGHTGYYDPEEDERENAVDNHTGYWYADWD